MVEPPTCKAPGTESPAEESGTHVQSLLEEEPRRPSLKLFGPEAHASNSEWTLYQCLLDDEHIASVALSINADLCRTSGLPRTLEFLEIDASDLTM